MKLMNRLRGIDEQVVATIDEIPQRSLAFPLQIAAPYVDLLNELPGFCDLSTEQLFKLLPKRYHKSVPPVGDDLGIREAAYQREVRMARAVIIGMLAKPEHVEQYQAQKFLDRL